MLPPQTGKRRRRFAGKDVGRVELKLSKMVSMVRRPYHRKRLADLEDLARSGVKSGAVINAKLAGCSQGRFSQSGRSLLESGNVPFVCSFQFGSHNPLNLSVEW